MAYEDFTTYDETDEGGNVTVTSTKVSWDDLSQAQTAHVSDSKGANHFSGDFEHLFEVQFSDRLGKPLIVFWALANSQADLKALIDAAADAQYLEHYQNYLRLFVMENGSPTGDLYTGSDSTTYYITLARDDNAGANSTGQLTAEIRTGSHTGTLQDTLTVDCAAGEQNDFEYVFGLMSYDTGEAAKAADGFTQNLDLQEEAPTVKPWWYYHEMMRRAS